LRENEVASRIGWRISLREAFVDPFNNHVRDLEIVPVRDSVTSSCAVPYTWDCDNPLVTSVTKGAGRPLSL